MMTRIQRLLFTTLSAAALMAADATGTWTGHLIPSDGDGSARPAHVILKQEGGTLTGTAGQNPSEQHPLQNGKAAEDGTLTFDIPVGEMVMKFALKQDGDQITGDITREREGVKQTAKLILKRDK